MFSVKYLLYLLLAANVIFSWMAFSNHSLFEKFKLQVGRILYNKEYYRVFSSAFLHVDLTHLIFNMIALYSFGNVMQVFLNVYEFAILYFVSLLVGSLLAIYFNKNNSSYSAVGASGAVSGVVFASILFYPYGGITFIFFPFVSIPSWIFGILYLLYTVYGMNKSNDNIGHEAHLGGAIAGVVLAILFHPEIAMQNWWLSLILLAIPNVIFFIKPKSARQGFEFKVLNDNVKRTKRSVDDLYYNEQFEREKELNRLLEKVSEEGLHSLSKREQDRLKELSK